MSRVRRTTTAILAPLLAIALTVATALPAAATIGAWHWSRATIYVQNDSPTNSWNDEMMDRVNYYRSLGVHYNLINGSCRAGYPCIVVKEANYGSTGWFGLTSYALGSGGTGCGPADDPYTWCNFTGASGSWTVVRLNTYLAAGEIIYESEILADACHEFGHAVGNLQHATGTTCMNATITSSTATTLSSTEGGELRTRFSTIPY